MSFAFPSPPHLLLIGVGLQVDTLLRTFIVILFINWLSFLEEDGVLFCFGNLKSSSNRNTRKIGLHIMRLSKVILKPMACLILASNFLFLFIVWNLFPWYYAYYNLEAACWDTSLNWFVLSVFLNQLY